MSISFFPLDYKKLISKEFWDSYKDTIKGYQLAATLGLDTPCEYLRIYGKVFDHSGLFDVPIKYGIWVPYIGESSIKGTVSSHFGPVGEDYAESTVVPFLIRYREIAESDDSSEIKLQNLNALGQEDELWKKYVYLKKYGYPDCLGHLWAFKNLTAIKGIGPAKARKLIGQGVYAGDDVVFSGTLNAD